MPRLSTMTLPVRSRPAPPSAHALYMRNKSLEGAWFASHMFSSIAALAIRFGMTLPLGSVSGVNKFIGVDDYFRKSSTRCVLVCFDKIWTKSIAAAELANVGDVVMIEPSRGQLAC